MPHYGSKAYWDERYAAAQRALGLDERGPENFEWYQGWEALSPHLLPLLSLEGGKGLSRDAEILVVGCGTSTIPAKLYAEGLHNITCVDFSQVVINQMRGRWADLQDMEFVVADACALPGADNLARASLTGPGTESSQEDWSNCFDLVFDKAMLDATLCGGGGRRTSHPRIAAAVILETWRCLKVSEKNE